MQAESVFKADDDCFKNIIDSAKQLQEVLRKFSHDVLRLFPFSETSQRPRVNSCEEMCAGFLRKLDISIQRHSEYIISDNMHAELRELFGVLKEAVEWYRNFIKNNVVDSHFTENIRLLCADQLANIMVKLSAFEHSIGRVSNDGLELEGPEVTPDMAEIFKQELGVVVDAANKKVNSHLLSFSKNLDEMLIVHGDRIEASRNKVEQIGRDLDSLYSIVASKGIANGFMKNAESERDLANVFRIIAVGLMVAMASIIWFEFENNIGATLSPENLYWRLALGLFFSFVLGYLIRQSAVHRAQQFYYQQKAFDLAAINPYLANMPEDKQFEIKRHIAERIFVPASTMQGGDSGSFGVQEMMGKIIDKLEFPKKKD